MRPTDSKVRSFKRQGVTILVLLLAFVVYYALVIPAQRTYFIQRNFRQLSGMGDQVRDVVVNLASSLANAARPQLHAASFSGPAPGPFIKAVQEAEPEPAAAPQPDLSRIRASINLIPNLDLIESSLNVAPSGEPAAVPELSCRVVGVGSGSFLEFTYHSGGNPDLFLKARSDLPLLIRPVVHRPDFDDVLLLDNKGEVIFQLSPSTMRVLKLDVPSEKSSEADLSNYAGTDYKMFAEPVQFATAVSHSSAQMIRWTLCGLIRSDRFQKETWAVNYTVVIVFVFLALLLIISWPFLNVWSMGTRDYLRPGDMILLACSTVALCAFLTLPVVDLYAYNRMEYQLDNGLKVLAEDMLGSFKQELGSIVQQLNLLNRRFLEPGNAGSHKKVLTNPDLVHLSGPDADPYPYFIMASWIDGEGNQLAKWTVLNENTPLVNVGHRQYFRIIVDGRPWTTLVSNQAVRFSLEPIYSVNTGENFSVLGLAPEMDRSVVATIDERLLSMENPVLPAGYGFCVIDSAGRVLFHSDEKRNLRENFFEECNQDPNLLAAVLGRTACHLDLNYGRSMHSLYTAPVPDLPWSLIVFREEQVLDTAQVEMVSTTVLLFFAYAALPALVFILIYAFSSRRYLIWFWPNEKRHATYRLLAAINLALVVFFVSMIALSHDPRRLIPFALIIPCLALLMSFFGLTSDGQRRIWSKLEAPFERLQMGHRSGYVISTGFLLVLLAVAPMLAFFKIAFDREIGLIVKQAQLQLSKDLESRTERVLTDLGREGFERARSRRLAQPELRDYLARRLSSQWDIHAGFFFNTSYEWLPAGSTPVPAHPCSSPVLDEVLNLLRPHYNDLDVLTRSVGNDGAADDTWRWTCDDNRVNLTRVGIHHQEPRTGQKLRITSDRLRMPAPSPASVPAFLVVFAAPFFIIYIVSDHVLLLRKPEPSVLSSPVLHPSWRASNPPLGPGKYLLLGPPRARKTDHLTGTYFARLQQGKFIMIDLRIAEDRKLLEPSAQDELLRDSEKAIVIDHFEYHLQDAEFNLTKLRLLQLLAFDDRRTVIIVSNVHPLHFHVDGEAAAGNDKKDYPVRSDKLAWVEALVPYKNLYCQSKTAVELQPMPEGSTTQQARALYRSLWYTCSPTEQETLHQVAQGRLVDSGRPELRALLGRRVLLRDPRVHLFDAGFERFVLSNYHAGDTVPESHEEQVGLWRSLRGPAITVLILVAGFFFLTQEELWNRTIALVTTFVAGVSVVAKGFELFQKSRLKRTPTE